jgi:hypothetical protein
MPTRIIRDGWLESEAINQLCPQAERFFLRLCLRADDFGRYSANPILLKSNLFPLREDMRSTDIPGWLAACESAGLIHRYQVEAKLLLQITKFRQRIKKNTRSKFPAPPEVSGNVPEIPEFPGRSGDSLESPGSSGTIPPYTEAEAETESKTEANPEPLAEPEVGPEVKLPGQRTPAPVSAPAVSFAGDSKVQAGAEGEPQLPPVLATAAFKAKWLEYTSYRRSSQMKALKPISVAKQWTEMATWGADGAIAAIDTTIRNGWRGIFPPKAGGARPAPLESRFSGKF